MPVSRNFLRFFHVLIIMTVGLMALGAGVRTMGAGLACPDWPLCFGQVIPDFHVGVYFEFIHRAYAGLVALLFFGSLIYLFRRPTVPAIVKALGVSALLVLLVQIMMGGLTVLKLLKVSVVTSHLLLATTFVSLLLLMAFFLNPASVKSSSTYSPSWFRTLVTLMPAATFAQIWLGGLVATSYAGVVCVDFPLCNGQWVPTLSGSIGLQVMHRFGAYTLALMGITIFALTRINREKPWMTSHLQRLGTLLFVVILAQVGVGIGNLLLYIPAWMTVLHQSMAIAVLFTGLRLAFVAHRAGAPVLDRERFAGLDPADALVAD